MFDDLKPSYPTADELEKRSPVTIKSTSMVASKRNFRTAALLLLVLFIGAGAALVFVPWVQTVQGKGRVIAYSPNERQQRVESPIDGRIAHWHVHEGDRVVKGQVLAEMEDIDPRALERLTQQRDAATQAVAAAATSLDVSKKNLSRQDALLARGLASQRAQELARIEVAKYESELSKAQAEVAKTETLLSRQNSQIVRATRDGTIMRIIAPQGGVVAKSGDEIAMLVPDTKQRAVELFINGNDLPLVSTGREVRLQFEGWPAIQFAGWPSVAVGTFGGRVGVIDASDDGSGNFRILIFPTEKEPWPEVRYLRQGVRAVGWVLLDVVTLGWELWRQFNGFPPTADPKDEASRTKNGIYGSDAKVTK